MFNCRPQSRLRSDCPVPADRPSESLNPLLLFFFLSKAFVNCDRCAPLSLSSPPFGCDASYSPHFARPALTQRGPLLDCYAFGMDSRTIIAHLGSDMEGLGNYRDETEFLKNPGCDFWCWIACFFQIYLQKEIKESLGMLVSFPLPVNLNLYNIVSL